MKRQVPFALVFIFGLFMLFQYFVPHENSEWVYEFLLDWIYIIGILALALGIWSLWRVAVDKIKHKKHDWTYSYVTLIGLFGMTIFGFTAKTGDSWGLYAVFVVAVLGAILTLVQSMASTSQKPMFAGISGLLALIAILIALFDDSWAFYFMEGEAPLQTNTMWVMSFQYVMIPILSTMFSLLAFFIASAAYRAFRARNLLATLLLLAALIVMMRFFPYLPGDLPIYISKFSNWLMNVPNLAAQRAIVIGVGLGIVATALKVILGIERGYMGKG